MGRHRASGICVLILLLTAAGVTSANAARPADGDFPWAGMPLCAAGGRQAVTVTARLDRSSFRYSLSARGSRVLGFVLDSFDRRGALVGHGGPNLLGDDTYRGSRPRLRAEVRWQLAAMATYRVKHHPCRAGAVRIMTSHRKTRLWRCSPTGVRYSAVLRCRLAPGSTSRRAQRVP